MRYIYAVTEESGTNEEVGKYKAYGLNVYEQKDDEMVLIRAVSDLFLDEQQAQKFAKLCTEEQLDVIHLDDVIDDMLAYWDRLA